MVFSLRPSDIEALDRLKTKFGVDSRAAVLRRLLRSADKA